MTPPLLAISEVSTPWLSFAEDLALYAAAGVEGIGILGRKLTGDDDLARFEESGLTATICMPSHPDDGERFAPAGAATVTGSSVTSILPYRHQIRPSGKHGRIDEICDAVQRLAAFEPACVRLDTGPRGDHDEATAQRLVVDGFKAVAAAAADVGITVGIEPVRASLRDDYGWINTMADGIDLLDRIDRPNVGLIFDTWHLWDTPNVLDDLRRHADRVAAVHVADWRVPTRSAMDRVLPGDGTSDLGAMLDALDTGGYTGCYELELVSDEAFDDSLWRRDPAELVRAGTRQFLDVWSTRRGPRMTNNRQGSTG